MRGAGTEVVSISGGETQARENDLADAGTVVVDRLATSRTPDDLSAFCTRIVQESAGSVRQP